MIQMRPKKAKVSFNIEEEVKPSSNYKVAKIKYNETSNGSVFANNIIPDELLSKILCSVDPETLLDCQLVCKHWHYLLRNYVWHKKAELTLSEAIPYDSNVPWTLYYFICAEKPFYKNLVKNHSGEEGILKHWTILENGGDGWKTESSPDGVRSLPDDSVFEDKTYCFTTSFSKCWKEQVVNLLDEGFNEYLLDYIQPTIRISEWFCCRPNIPATYECTIKLLGAQRSDRIAIETLSYCKVIEGEQMNQWFKFTHEFRNYGKGLRKIKFCHGGQDRFYAMGEGTHRGQNYGTKMAGACIKLVIPT